VPQPGQPAQRSSDGSNRPKAPWSSPTSGEVAAAQALENRCEAGVP
jgi:hypothetical protein